MKRGTRRGTERMAECADAYVLYEQAVQCVEADIDFVDETFKRLRQREAYSLREDFCGTANAACEWVRRRSRNRAVGIDLNRKVLDWGIAHHIAQLPPKAARRIRLINEDVMKVDMAPMDTVIAMNFSYWIFKERSLLRRYFRRVLQCLVKDGILFLDAFGGYDACRASKERTRHNGFTYIWNQADYNPISCEILCHIDFAFEDGSRLKRAFTYDWRLWTLPELTELLTESGFRRATIYWQGTDEKTGEGDGRFYPTTRGKPDAGWIAYIVAEK
ncbi:MAG: methyltransferase domain-containing protein [Gammaproteobacteria bacterium]|nr:methyltransferase domain-containing protein [Gammaproteobacteria bacterium]MCI0591445.1 methyltransferase domain-containing protein [Gammaproteobacteria bacterium]